MELLIEGMPVIVGIVGMLVAAGALVGVEVGEVLVLPPQAARSSTPTTDSIASILNFRRIKCFVTMTNPFIYFGATPSFTTL